MPFTKVQQQYVKTQLRRHRRSSGTRRIVLDEGKRQAISLYIESGVFGSDIMSPAIYLARFLFENISLFRGKEVLDLGCGPGTHGLLMAKYGAKTVVLSDISRKAVNNAKINIKNHKVKNAEVFCGDLFASLEGKKFDVIVFNHPFFSGEAKGKEIMLKKTMLGGTKLIKRFFEDAKKYLNDNGTIVMPYFHFAGSENDPASHAEKYGFRISKLHKMELKQGLQKGAFTIYEIKALNQRDLQL